MACWAQREEPMGEGRPQSWKAGTKGTRRQRDRKGACFLLREGTPHSLFPQPSISLAHPWARKHPTTQEVAHWPSQSRPDTTISQTFFIWSGPSGLLDQSVSCLIDASPAPTCVLCVCIFILEGGGREKHAPATHPLPRTPSEPHCLPSFAFLS